MLSCAGAAGRVSSSSAAAWSTARARPPASGCEETCLLRPDNPYAASKAAADLLSYQYTRHPGLDIVRVRPFNHIGPRQSPQFAVASFARQWWPSSAAGSRRYWNRQPRSRRDLTDVRDMVAAYLLLMERGRTGEVYNVGSGQNYAMQTVLDRLLALSGVAVEVRQKDSLVRATDDPRSFGPTSPSCGAKRTGRHASRSIRP